MHQHVLLQRLKNLQGIKSFNKGDFKCEKSQTKNNIGFKRKILILEGGFRG